MDVGAIKGDIMFLGLKGIIAAIFSVVLDLIWFLFCSISAALLSIGPMYLAILVSPMWLLVYVIEIFIVMLIFK